jgi:hypothetical protein
MPGIKGIERAEFKRGAELHSEAKALDREVAPYVRSLEVERSPVFSSSEPREKLESFISLGEMPAVEIPASHMGKPGFFSGFREIVQRVGTQLKRLSGGIGPVAPMMIFSFLLRPGSRKVATAMEFAMTLDKFNQELAQFDRAKAYQREGWPLSPDMKITLSNAHWVELNRERSEFIKENFRHHHFESVFTQDSSGAKGFRISHPEQNGLSELLQPSGQFAPRIFLGEQEMFLDTRALLRFSEEVLAKAYREGMPAGSMLSLSFVDPRGEALSADLSVLESSQGEGRHLVLRIDFPKSIGKESIARIEAADVVGESPGAPERKILDAEEANTNILIIVGGEKKSELGLFQLQDVSLGRFAYRRFEANFWAEHVYVQEKTGARRGVYFNWLNRRPGFEIPVDGMGRLYSIELGDEFLTNEFPRGAKLVKIVPWGNGMIGSLLPGDKQAQITFRALETSETIALILARNQSGIFVQNPEQTYLLTPIADLFLETTQGFYREAYLFPAPARRKASPSLDPEKAQALGPYRSPPPMPPGVQVQGVNDRYLFRTLRRAANNSGFRANQAMRLAQSMNLDSTKEIFPRVSLLTHTLNGEQRIRISGLPSSTKNIFFEDIVITLDDAQKIGAVEIDGRGHLFAGRDLHELQVGDREKWE